MKKQTLLNYIVSLAILFGSVLPGSIAWAQSLATPEQPNRVIIVITHPKNSIEDLSIDNLRLIFMGKRRSWPSGHNIVPINFSAKSRMRVIFDQLVLKMTPREAGIYWVEQKIRAQARPPKSVTRTNLVQKIVAAVPGAISYVISDDLSSRVKPLTINGIEHTSSDYPLIVE